MGKFIDWKSAICRMIVVMGLLPCPALVAQEKITPTPAAGVVHRRLVAIRYPAESVSSHNKLNTLINNDLQALYANRLILPDPDSTAHHDQWLATAKELAAAGRDVWVELSPECLTEKRTSTDPSIQLFDPESAKVLEKSYLKRIQALAALKTEKGRPVVGGFFLPLVPAKTLPGGWDVGLSESVFRNFLEETGLEQDWAARLTTEAERRAFVRSAGLVPWLAWRSRKVADFYSRLADQTQAQTGLCICVTSPAANNELARSLFEEAERSGSSPLIAWRWMAFEPALWKRVSGLELIGSETIEPKSGTQELAAHPDVESAFSEWPGRGQWLTTSPSKPLSKNNLKTHTREDLPATEAAIVASLARRDIAWLVLDHQAIVGQEAAMADTARRFQALPASLAPLAAAISTQLQGLTIRSYVIDSSMVIAFFNPLPCRMDVSMTFSEPIAKTIVRDYDAELDWRGANESSASLGEITLCLEPKSWGRFELGMRSPETVSFEVKLPDDAKEVVQTRYDQLLGHRTHAAKPQTSGLVAVGHIAEKTRGRRLMAALQAYRESRLADFFRLSDGILPERRMGRGVESTARGFQDDLSDRPKIR